MQLWFPKLKRCIPGGHLSFFIAKRATIPLSLVVGNRLNRKSSIVQWSKLKIIIDRRVTGFLCFLCFGTVI